MEQQSHSDIYLTQQLNNQSSNQISSQFQPLHPPVQMYMDENYNYEYYLQLQEQQNQQNENLNKLAQQWEVQSQFFQLSILQPQPDYQNSSPQGSSYKYFPFVEANYTNINDVAKKIKPLELITQDERIIIDSTKKQFFHFFTSNSLYNLHQAAKYGIWTSPRPSIQNTIYKFQKNEQNYPGQVQYIGLFVHIVGDSQLKLFGVAEIDIQFHSNQSYYLWDKVDSYYGYFNITWLRIGELEISIPGFNNKTTLSHLQKNTIETKKIFNEYLKKCDPNQLLKKFRDLDSQEINYRKERLSLFNTYTIFQEFFEGHYYFETDLNSNNKNQISVDSGQQQQYENEEEEQQQEQQQLQQQEEEEYDDEQEYEEVELENKKENERYLHTINLDDENVLEEILESGIDVSSFFK